MYEKILIVFWINFYDSSYKIKGFLTALTVKAFSIVKYIKKSFNNR
jgi:hypothetical protein